MAQRGIKSGTVEAAGIRRRPRRDLLATTALQASAVLLLAMPAAAQPAPNARPQGGTVVAGQASIGQTATQTTVAQASQRAALDWRSFDVGSGHTVAFQQPNATSITLNRVTGPDPSQIAGRITANGQVAIVNGSGVVFHAGSQVDVQSLVVSTAGISNANFMAGRMAFDQPGKPGAAISNAGTITVAETGLAALVAPQVANSGRIVAKMGRVVLAGGEAHAVDLYGDGLMSVEVTREVRQAPGGATALVTNTGTVVADGGSIVLTAKAVDGIMQNLVVGRGRLQANTANGRTGTVVLSSIGGSTSVEGVVQAAGRAPGAAGGTIVLNATDTVAVGSAARVSAAGQAGGGTVAVGTTPARARVQSGGVPAGSARVATVAEGARISANGRGTGSGGTVAVLATDRTVVAGRLSTRGGPQGGDGGQVEISANRDVRITGPVDTRAPNGKMGLLTIDPTTLTIGGDANTPANPAPDNGGVDPAAPQSITAATFNAFTTNVSLQASGDINLVGATTLGTTTAGVSVRLTAGGTLTVGTALIQPGDVTLAGRQINLNAPVSVGANTLTLNGGDVTQTAAGTVTAQTLQGSSTGTVRLGLSDNAVNTVGTFTAFDGFELRTVTNLTIAGVLATDRQVSLTAASLAQQPSGTVIAPSLTGRTTGSALLDTAPNTVTTLAGFVSGGDFKLTSENSLRLSADVVAGGGRTIALNAPSLTVGGTAGNLRFGTVENGTFTQSTVQATDTAFSSALLKTDSLVVRDTSPTAPFWVDARGGRVAIAPLAANGTVTVGTGTGLSLTEAQLRLANTIGTEADVGTGGPRLLQLGSIGALPAPGGANPATAASVTLDAGLNLSNRADKLALFSTGSVTQTSGGVTVNQVLGASGGAFTLDLTTAPGTPFPGASYANRVSELGQVTAGGTVSIASQTNLAVIGSGPVKGADVALSSAGDVTGSGVTGGTVGFKASGQVGVGGVGAAGLTGSAGGDFGVAGSFSQAAGITAGGNLSLASGIPLELAGTITSQGTATVSAPTLASSGTVGSGGAATLKATTGDFRQTGGIIRTDLATAAPLSAQTPRADLAITAAGTINLNGVTAGNTVRLSAGGAIAQGASGALVASTLTGNAASVSLPAATDGSPGQQGNQVARLGAFTVSNTAPGSGTFTLRNSRNLDVTGAVQASGDVSITAQSGRGTPAAGETQPADGGTLRVTGSIAGANATLLAFGDLTGGNVTTPQDTGTVSLSAGGNVSMGGVTGNRVGGQAGASYGVAGSFNRAGAIQAGDSLVLASVRALTLDRPSVSQGDAAVTAPSLTVENDLFSGRDATLSATNGFVTQTAGNVGAARDIRVSAAGDIVQAGGLLAAGRAATLSAGGNAVQTGGELAGASISIDAGGTASFGAARSPTVTVFVPDVNLKGVLPVFGTPTTAVSFGSSGGGGGGPPLRFRLDAGDINLAMPVTAGTVELHSIRDTVQSSEGVISARVLTGTAGYTRLRPGLFYEGVAGAGTVVLTNPGNRIAGIGPYYSGGDMAVTSATALAVTDRVVAGGSPAGTGTILPRGPDAPASGALLALTAPSLTVLGTADGLRFGTVTEGAFSATLPAGPNAGNLVLPARQATNAAFDRINLLTDRLELQGTGTKVEARGGRVAIAPLSAGRAVSVDGTRVETTLSLVSSEMARINLLDPRIPDRGAPGELRLGALGNTATGAAPRLDINAPLALNDTAATLGLYSAGDITENAGGRIAIGRPATAATPAVTGVLEGAAGGRVLLVDGTGREVTLQNADSITPANTFDVLRNFTAGNGLSVAGTLDARSGGGGITVEGRVASGAGDLGLLSVGQVSNGVGTSGTLNIAGTVSAPGQTLTLVARDGSSAGPAMNSTSQSLIVAQTLTGKAATSDVRAANYDVLLDRSQQQVARLADFTVGSPAGTPIRAQGGFQLDARGGPGLDVAGQVTAKRVVVTAKVMAVTGAIGACLIDGNDGTVALTAGRITSSGTIGGQRSVALSGNGAGQGDITQTGGLINAPAVTLDGTFNQTGGRVVGGAVTTGTLTQSGGSIWIGQDFAAYAPVVGGTIASGGNITLTGMTNLLAGGRVLADKSVSVNAPDTTPLSLAGTIVAGQNLVVTQGTRRKTQAGGGITQSGGSLSAGGMADVYAADGPASQTGGTLAATTVQAVALGGDNSFTPSTRAPVSGSVGVPVTYLCPGCIGARDPGDPGALSVLPSPATPAAVRLDGVTITLARPVSASSIELHSVGATTATGRVDTDALSGTAGLAISGYSGAGLPTYGSAASSLPGNAAFSEGTSRVARLGAYEATGDFALSAAGGVTVAERVRAGATLSINLLGSTAGLSIGDAAAAATLAGSTVRLNVPGAVTQGPGTVLEAGTLQGSAGSIALPEGNAVAALGGLDAASGLLLNTTSSLRVGGAVTSRGGRLVLTSDGSLTLDGGSLAAPSVSLGAVGAVTAPNGFITADTLTASAASVELPSEANRVAELGATEAQSGSIQLVNGQSLVTSGAVQASGDVVLTVTGDLTTRGAVIAQTLSTTSTGSTALSGSITAAKSVDVSAGTEARLESTGEVSAPRVVLGRLEKEVPTTPRVTLQGGRLTVGGTEQSGVLTQLPGLGSNMPDGLYLSAVSRVVQTGPTQVFAQPGLREATVRITIGRGEATFEDLSAATSNVLLDLRGNKASGAVTVRNLFVSYDPAPGGSVSLTGTVAGISGIGAAGTSGIAPRPNQDYRINDCAIAAANCIVLRSQTVPVFNPLKEQALNFFRDQDDDTGLIVPNITDQGL